MKMETNDSKRKIERKNRSLLHPHPPSPLPQLSDTHNIHSHEILIQFGKHNWIAITTWAKFNEILFGFGNITWHSARETMTWRRLWTWNTSQATTHDVDVDDEVNGKHFSNQHSHSPTAACWKNEKENPKNFYRDFVFLWAADDNFSLSLSLSFLPSVYLYSHENQKVFVVCRF